MTTQIECAGHITFACEAVSKPFQKVKDLFKDYEITVIDTYDKGIKNRYLEVRFDSATLTCLFSENNICGRTFLFLDDVFDITYYIEYCNKTYPCNFTLKGWVINSCFVQITTEHQECSLLVTPIKQE